MPQSSINPADFVSVIDNSYFPLQPGTTYITESDDGSTVGTFTVTRQTRVIEGVTCIVVSDISTVDGELSEKTTDYFAQDKNGNIWYFGEDTAEYENGQVVSTEGTWLAGVGGAEPGIVMEAAPKLGDSYDQENAPGVAEDHAAVIAVNQSVNTPYANFGQALVTNETTPLDASSVEHKFYVKGIGFVQAIDQVSGEVEQLVKIKFDGTSHADAITGKIGTDELNGRSGDDRLDGAGGSDVVNGGAGNDQLDGGKDSLADLLHGGLGNDVLFVRTADRAFGDAGNDIFRLYDNAHFGRIDGGSESNADLAHAKGDVLKFNGALDLTAPGLAAHVSGIETLSMRNGNAKDSLTLNAADLLELGDGHFDPALCGKDGLNVGAAVRVDGDACDRLNLTGGHWKEVNAGNVPDHYDLFVNHAGGNNVYVLVQDDVTVHTS